MGPIPPQPSVPTFAQAFPTAAGAAPPQAPAQAAASSPPQGPRFVFSVEDQGGQTGTVDETYIAQQLQQAGYGVKGVTADGAHLQMVDAKGDYEVPIRSFLAGLGWNVTGSRPVQADYENVQPGWRASMSLLPDDVEKHAYLLKALGELGMAEPRIEGAGDDWYVHNPATADWIALTNKPGLDASDILPAASSATHAIGAGAAGLAAAETGPGAILAGAAGGAATEAAMRGLTALVDPTFRDIAGQNLGGQMKDVGLSAVGDLAGGALGGLAGAGAKRLFGPTMARAMSRPGSTAAQGFGAVAKPVGRGLSHLGAAADTEMGRYIASSAIPGIGGAVNAGFAAQLPAMAMRLPVAGVAKAAGTGIAKKILGEPAARATQWTANHILNAPSTSGMFGRAANLAAAPFRQPTMAERLAYIRDFGFGIGSGKLPFDVARQYARGRSLARSGRPGGSAAYDLGAKVGMIPEGLEALGRPLERFGLGMTGLGAKGLKYGGAALNRAGQAADKAAAYGRAFEPYLERIPFTERYISDPLRSATNTPWADQQPRRTMLAEEGL